MSKPIPFQKPVSVSAFIDGAVEQNNKLSEVGNAVPVDNELMVSITKLHDNPVNARYFYNINRIEELAKMIDEDGQLVPLMITNHPSIDGEYVVIGGGYRLRAMRFLGRVEVRCALMPNVAGFQLYHLSNAVNKQRTTQSLLDDAKVWKKLLSEKMVASQDELAHSLGMNKGQISKVLSLNDIPEDISQLLSSSPLATQINLAYEFSIIAKLCQHDELMDIVHHILENGISLKELSSIKKSKDKKKDKKPDSDQIKNIQLTAENGKKMGYIKVEKKKIAVTFTALSDAKASELSEKIDALVREYL